MSERTRPDIFLITTLALWERAREQGAYRSDALETEGFLHCSEYSQVARVAQAVFPGRHDLVLLRISPDAVIPQVRYEPSGTMELFPHSYGTLNLDAIVEVLPFEPDDHGIFPTPKDRALEA